MVQELWPTCQVPWPMPVTVFSPGQLQGRVPCSPHLHLPHLQLSYRGGPGMVHTGTPWLVHTLAVLLWWPQHGLSLLHLQLAIRVAPVWYAPDIYQLTSASAPVILSRGLNASHPRTPWSAYSSFNCPAKVALMCAETLLICTCSSSTSLSKVTLNVCPKTLLSVPTSGPGSLPKLPVVCSLHKGHSYIRPQRKLCHHYSRYLYNTV